MPLAICLLIRANSFDQTVFNVESFGPPKAAQQAKVTHTDMNNRFIKTNSPKKCFMGISNHKPTRRTIEYRPTLQRKVPIKTCIYFCFHPKKPVSAFVLEIHTRPDGDIKNDELAKIVKPLLMHKNAVFAGLALSVLEKESPNVNRMATFLKRRATVGVAWSSSSTKQLMVHVSVRSTPTSPRSFRSPAIYRPMSSSVPTMGGCRHRCS